VVCDRYNTEFVRWSEDSCSIKSSDEEELMRNSLLPYMTWRIRSEVTGPWRMPISILGGLLNKISFITKRKIQ